MFDTQHIFACLRNWILILFFSRKNVSVKPRVPLFNVKLSIIRKTVYNRFREI